MSSSGTDGAVAGSIYLPNIVPEPAVLLRDALARLHWDQRMRSRQTASVGIAYNYSGISYPNVPLPPFVVGLVRQIEAVVGHRITNCLANYYPTGASRMGFHSDSGRGVVDGTTTAILSLGASRALTFRHKERREVHLTQQLESGSLFVMAYEIQGNWEHALLPAEATGPRMSLTFRHLVE